VLLSGQLIIQLSVSSILSRICSVFLKLHTLELLHDRLYSFQSCLAVFPDRNRLEHSRDGFGLPARHIGNKGRCPNRKMLRYPWTTQRAGRRQGKPRPRIPPLRTFIAEDQSDPFKTASSDRAKAPSSSFDLPFRLRRLQGSPGSRQCPYQSPPEPRCSSLHRPGCTSGRFRQGRHMGTRPQPGVSATVQCVYKPSD